MMGEGRDPEPGGTPPSPGTKALLTHSEDLDALALQLCRWPLSIILGLAIRDEDADLRGQARAVRPSPGPTDPPRPSQLSPGPPPCRYLGDPWPELRGAEEVVSDVAESGTGPCVAALVAQLLDGPPDACAIGVLGEGELHPGGRRGRVISQPCRPTVPHAPSPGLTVDHRCTAPQRSAPLSRPPPAQRAPPVRP